MQNNGRHRRSRKGRRRSDTDEQQPLTNESAIGLLSQRRRRNSSYNTPPSMYDPNYVPGRNPQYADPDSNDVNSVREERSQHRYRRDRRPSRRSAAHGQRHEGNVEGAETQESFDGTGRQPHYGEQPSLERQYNRGRRRRRRGRHHTQGASSGAHHGNGAQPQSQGVQPGNEYIPERGRRRRRQRTRSESQPPTSDSTQQRSRHRRTGGRGSQSKRAGKGRMSFGLAKRRAIRETGRSKVYTSDMFLYKENLDPRKPAERKMRSRRHKPSDDTNTMES